MGGKSKTGAGQESGKDSEVWLVRAAARALSDGLSGRKVRPPPARTPQALRAHIFRLKHHPVAWFASVALLVLSFVEPPYWCETADRCEALWGSYPQAHVGYVGEGGAVAWTLICLAPLVLDEVLRVRSNGRGLRGSLSSVKGLAVPILVLLTLAAVSTLWLLPRGVAKRLRVSAHPSLRHDWS